MAGKPSCFLQCCNPCTCLASCAACLNVELMSWVFQQACCVRHLVRASFACCLVLPGFSMKFFCMLPGAAWLQHELHGMEPILAAADCPTALLEACFVLQQRVARALCK